MFGGVQSGIDCRRFPRSPHPLPLLFIFRTPTRAVSFPSHKCFENACYAGYMLVTKKMGRSRARTVYKGLYNWPNETIGKQHNTPSPNNKRGAD